MLVLVYARTRVRLGIPFELESKAGGANLWREDIASTKRAATSPNLFRFTETGQSRIYKIPSGRIGRS